MLLVVIVVLITASMEKGLFVILGIVVLFLYSMASWVIYGYTLYNSDENNCSIVRATNGWSTMMVILLVFGTIFVLYASLITCIVPCMVFALLA